jgi:AcrR family transcriptional regulator
MTSLREVAAAAPAAPTATPASTLSPVSARRTRTRQRLMASAVAVFAERGVIGSSVEELCEAAGFTRGAFYSNFADKDELVLAMIEQGIAEEYAAAEEAVTELKAQGARLAAADLVAQVLDRLNHGGRSDRTTLLAQRELLLYAARVPELRAPRSTSRVCVLSTRSEKVRLCADGSVESATVPARRTRARSRASSSSSANGLAM